jgi:RimJ/RimL family protein N-acetyltransferase
MTTHQLEADPEPVPPAAVGLRPVVAGDYGWMFALEMDPETLPFYRHRARTPTFDDYVRSISSGVLAQFVIFRLDDSQPVGLVAAYGADLRNGHARIAAILGPAFRKAGWPLEGIRLFVRYLFDEFPLRKLYADVLDPIAASTGLARGDLGVLEARYVEHEYVDGEWIDLLTFAVFREQFQSDETRPHVIERAILASRSAEEFAEVIIGAIFPGQAGSKSLGPDCCLGVDLGFDSLGLLEVYEVLNRAAGGYLGKQVVSAETTLRDVFEIANGFPAS